MKAPVKAGMSPGLRLVTRLPSATASRSTTSAPAFLRSVRTDGQLVTVRPRTVYADQSRPALVEGFTRDTFTAMVRAVRDDAVAAGLTTPEEFDRGIADLRRTAGEGGTFH